MCNESSSSSNYEPTDKEVSSVQHYTREEYRTVNGYLRKGDEYLDKYPYVDKQDVLDSINNLDNVMQNSVTNQDMKLYRGVDEYYRTVQMRVV